MAPRRSRVSQRRHIGGHAERCGSRLCERHRPHHVAASRPRWTELSYSADFRPGGKLAAVGDRLFGTAVKRNIADFLDRSPPLSMRAGKILRRARHRSDHDQDQSIETVLLDLPMIRPHLLAMTVMRKRTLLLVRVMCSDAIEGWGEATSIGGLAYGDESPEGVKLCIDTFITPAIHGIDATNINAAIELIGRVVQGNPFAKAAIETALLDAHGKRRAVSVSELLGGRYAARCRSSGRWRAAIRSAISTKRSRCSSCAVTAFSN